jgi:chromate reductase
MHFSETSAPERPGHPVEVLAIAGSVRPDSLNVRLLNAARRVAGPRAEISIVPSSDLYALPPYDPDSPMPEPAARLREAIEEAEAVLIATPEYNNSIPGGLKNAVDWAGAPAADDETECPMRGKPAAVIGADRSRIGCDWALADARKVLESVGARTIPFGLSVAEAELAFGEDGALLDDGQARRLAEVVDELIVEGSAPH